MARRRCKHLRGHALLAPQQPSLLQLLRRNVWQATLQQQRQSLLRNAGCACQLEVIRNLPE
eukprot:8947017-Lingulodinium_polyedra.AAC.1